MTKSQLIDTISKQAKVTKTVAESVVKTFIGTVSDCLKKGESLTLVGFGTFGVRDRAARTGRNPQTGAEIKIGATKVPVFRPGKMLKEEVKGKSGKKK